jgi:hypothetical protein
MEILLVVGVTAILLVLLLVQRKKWRVLESGRGEAAAGIYAKHEFLKSRRLTARIVTEQAQQLQPGDDTTTVRLEVPEKSLDQALSALQEFR